MIEDREFGALEARVKRLESVKERLLDYLPLVATLGMVGGLWFYVVGEFKSVDARFDQMFVSTDARFDRVDDRLLRIEQQLTELAKR